MGLNATLRFIDNQAALDLAVLEMARYDRFGVDTETAYWKLGKEREKLALIQIAVEVLPGRFVAWVIDAMARLDLKSLRAVLQDEGSAKAMHNASFDAAALSRHAMIDVASMWCTLRAERRNGRKKGAGLEPLALEYLGYKADKSFQQYDWSIRPLPQKALVYAGADAVLALRIMGIQESKGLNGRYTHKLEEQASIFDEAQELTAAADADREHEWLKSFLAEEQHKKAMPKLISFFLDCKPPYLVWDLEEFAPQLEELVARTRAGKQTKKPVSPEDVYDSCAPPAPVDWLTVLSAFYRRFALGEVGAETLKFENRQKAEREALRKYVKRCDEADNAKKVSI